MDVFFIYGLVDAKERSEIRYVGQTFSLVKRTKQHRISCLWDWGPPSLWKRVMAAFCREFEPVLLEVVYGSRDDAQDREKFHIDRLEASTGRILNSPAYRKTQKRRGVPRVVTETYIDAFRMMLEGWQEDRFACRNRAASIVDRLQQKYTSLAICGPWDKFSWADRADRVQELWGSGIDSAIVSR